MWYEYFDNSLLVTGIYTQVPSLDIFLLKEIQLQQTPSTIRLRGNLSRFPDASLDWSPPYNSIQLILEFSEAKVAELTITNPLPDIVVSLAIDKIDEEHISLQLSSPQCSLHAYFHRARIISIKKYVLNSNSR